jgi:hypothetical protein
VRIASPSYYEGLEPLIHHVKPPSADSCWQAPGCAVEFDLHEWLLEARRAGLHGAGFLHNRDLRNLALGPAASLKAVAPFVREKADR